MATGECEIIGRIETGSHDSRLEIAITERDGAPMISIHLSTFSDALGWQIQKTIPIAANKIATLQRLLCETRNRLDEISCPADDINRVIQFAQRSLSRSSPSSSSTSSSAGGEPAHLERAG